MTLTIDVVVSFFTGASSSWLITHVYYRRSRRDSKQTAADQVLAHRIDWATRIERAFIVALHCEPNQPLYSSLNWEAETTEGATVRCASGRTTMFRSLRARDSHLLQVIHRSTEVPHQRRFGLTDRGNEIARYLLRTEFRSGRWSSVDDSRAQAIFAAEGFPPVRK